MKNVSQYFGETVNFSVEEDRAVVYLEVVQCIVLDRYRHTAHSNLTFFVVQCIPPLTNLHQLFFYLLHRTKSTGGGVEMLKAFFSAFKIRCA
mgnify:CR=1 FL=1